MVISTYTCGSCAVNSITNLGVCKDPVDAMAKFCKHELGALDQFRSKYSTLVCYYIFCAGPEVTSKANNGSHHSKDHWPKYGTEFAQFIVDNGLGEIVTVGPKLNKKYHPTTTAQLWAWSPNQKALEKWWTTFQTAKTNNGA